MAEFLRLLLRVSEKAANVARVCRTEAPLFGLLIQEKTGEDKNKKFVQDFKTLADVVIQEMIKHDVVAKFPEMKGFIHGEESNKFENGLGESVTITLCGTEQETATLLATVLDGDTAAAALLARAVHQDPQVEDQAADSLQLPLEPADLAVWIDPIDGTSQYIEGREEDASLAEPCPSGLPCALVLIGAYMRSSGEPVIGVINQPFFRRDPAHGGWTGRHFWGASAGTINASSLSTPLDRTGSKGQLSIVLSSSEKQVLKDALEPLCGGKLMYVSGAGYKILCVILGLADLYVFSEGSTFKWDSCGPHAVLRALGGGVVDLEQCLKGGSPTELAYHQPSMEHKGAERWANHGGIVAYLDSKRLAKVIGALSGKI